MIVFVVSGFWHGANWTFIFWGFLNAIYFLPLLLTNKNRTHLDIVAEEKILPSFKESIQIIITFLMVSFSWVFFRSVSMNAAFNYLYRIADPGNGMETPSVGISLLSLLCVLLVLIDWSLRQQIIPFANFSNNRVKRYLAYSIIASLILFYGAFVNPQSFIYFQF